MLTIKRLYPGDDLSPAFIVRDKVFTIEQGFSPEIEIDDQDPLAHHIVFYRDQIPFATARTFPKSKEEPGVYIIGRVCILKDYRGGGIGLALMEEIEGFAIELGATALELGAQCTAAPFYQRRGFFKTEETYYEEFCQHVIMVKEL